WHGGVSERKTLSRSNHDRFKWQPDQSSSGLHREALGKSRSSPAQTSTAVEEGTGVEPEEEHHKGRTDGNRAPADSPTGRRKGLGTPVCQIGHTLLSGRRSNRLSYGPPADPQRMWGSCVGCSAPQR